MNKRLILILGVPILLIVAAYLRILAYDNILKEKFNFNAPYHITSYSDTGYYKFDPETILNSLERGYSNAFSPMEEDPKKIKGLTNISIRWTQTDFLKIASALGQYLWGDPMDLEDWNVYLITLDGSCEDPIGYYYASITYFRMRDNRYSTRMIEIEPTYGWVRWADGATYSKPILHKWNSVELLRSNITADEALRVASEDAKIHFQIKDSCSATISSPRNSDTENWYLDIFTENPNIITYILNLQTGDYVIHSPNN